jgi:hypothetical protein
MPAIAGVFYKLHAHFMHCLPQFITGAIALISIQKYLAAIF